MQAPPLGVDGRIGHHFYIKLKNKLKKHFNKFGWPSWPPLFLRGIPIYIVANLLLEVIST